MKVKDQYLKILKNFLYYDPKFSYDGSKHLIYKSKHALVEAYLPEFIDLPIYTTNLEDILKFWTPETDVSEEVEGEVSYLVMANDKGTIRYRLSKSQLLAPKEIIKPIDDREVLEIYFKFNLDYNKFSNLIKISKLLECNTVEVYSIDEHKIGLKSFNINDKRSKNYIMEIENDHIHTDKKIRFTLEGFELIMASDYNFELGKLNNSKQIEYIKVRAFNGNVEVKYMFPASI